MIFTFEEFINESYLKSGRHLLYHYTRRFVDVLKSDLLKTSQAADEKISISFTRSPYYREHSSAFRLVLDSDELKKHGFNVVPYDEVGNIVIKHKRGKSEKFKDYSKVNPYFKGKHVINNVGIKPSKLNDISPMEWEYEERIFKNIPNLGKYLVAIDVSEEYIKDYVNIIKEYLDKYPHIEVTLLKENLYDRRTKIDIQKLYQDSKTKSVKVEEYLFV